MNVQIRNRTGSNLEKAIFGKRVTDKSSDIFRKVVQRRQGFKPQDYNDILKNRTQEGISNLKRQIQKDSLQIQTAEHKLLMSMLLKQLETKRSFYQVVYKREVLGQTVREKKRWTKQTLIYYPKSQFRM
ncbi:MAG: hypothetical protein EZS28_046661 [Streblomastix strix]|uniref:Uncharacterized protein n=1 Tax=Streblomastix strix TaxID=222440 RepID=A0A5J4TJ68_9EUKA|nr:MAG: hypothetical protein EZS28_046661 [Streblomastix strix]